MTARARALFALAVIVSFGVPAAAEAPVGGVTIGSTIAALVRESGFPASVESMDTGNRFTFAGAVAYANDDGIVVAAETAAGSVTVEIDRKLKTFAIGTYTMPQADAELSNVAEFAADGVRTYRLSPERELVLLFDRTTQKLARIAYGQRGQLARLGLVSGDDGNKTVPYKAPRLRHTALSDGNGSRATIVKLEIGRSGDVKTVAIVVPSSDSAFDENVPKVLVTDRFIPATLAGRAIGATVFREIRH